MEQFVRNGKGSEIVELNIDCDFGDFIFQLLYLIGFFVVVFLFAFIVIKLVAILKDFMDIRHEYIDNNRSFQNQQKIQKINKGKKK